MQVSIRSPIALMPIYVSYMIWIRFWVGRIVGAEKIIGELGVEFAVNESNLRRH